MSFVHTHRHSVQQGIPTVAIVTIITLLILGFVDKSLRKTLGYVAIGLGVLYVLFLFGGSHIYSKQDAHVKMNAVGHLAIVGAFIVIAVMYLWKNVDYDMRYVFAALAGITALSVIAYSVLGNTHDSYQGGRAMHDHAKTTVGVSMIMTLVFAVMAILTWEKKIV